MVLPDRLFDFAKSGSKHIILIVGEIERVALGQSSQLLDNFENMPLQDTVELVFIGAFHNWYAIPTEVVHKPAVVQLHQYQARIPIEVQLLLYYRRAGRGLGLGLQAAGGGGGVEVWAGVLGRHRRIVWARRRIVVLFALRVVGRRFC